MGVVDTSVAIPALVAGHPAHNLCWDYVTSHGPSIAGHAAIEAFSVLTRLPVADRLSGAEAHAMLQSNFPHVIWPASEDLARFLERCRDSGVTGGAIYDALVALSAVAVDEILITLDHRARRTYAAMGVAYASPNDRL